MFEHGRREDIISFAFCNGCSGFSEENVLLEGHAWKVEWTRCKLLQDPSENHDSLDYLERNRWIWEIFRRHISKASWWIWIWAMKERITPRKTRGFLIWATGKMLLLFTEIRFTGRQGRLRDKIITVISGYVTLLWQLLVICESTPCVQWWKHYYPKDWVRSLT